MKNSIIQPAASNKHAGIRMHVIFGAIILLSLIICYQEVLLWMYERYKGADSYYSHGFFIPFVSAYFIWIRKEELKGKEIKACWWGFILIAFALIVNFIGHILYVFSVSGFSILFLVFGSCIFIYGKNITRIIIFPLFFLFFMFPLPMAIIEIISFPIKILVTNLGVDLIALGGIPIFNEGFHISIPSGNFIVDNPCSGLRSLITLLALGAIFAHLENISLPKKWFLFLMTIPAAIISNMIRIVILILIGHFWGIDTVAPESIWHTGTGLITFLIAFMLIFLLARLLRWKKKNKYCKRINDKSATNINI